MSFKNVENKKVDFKYKSELTTDVLWEDFRRENTSGDVMRRWNNLNVLEQGAYSSFEEFEEIEFMKYVDKVERHEAQKELGIEFEELTEEEESLINTEIE